MAAGVRKRTAALEILLVEDNPGDVRLVEETLKEVPIGTHLNVVEDGTTAVAYLYRHGPYAQAPRPDLILLDLELPRLDGRELLRVVKADHLLFRVPVVVLTSSQAEADVLHTSALQIKSYVNKPVGVEEMREILQAVEKFWRTAGKGAEGTQAGGE